MRSYGWAMIQYDWCPFQKRESGHIQHADGGMPVGVHGEKVIIHKPRRRRETSEETKVLIRKPQVQKSSFRLSPKLGLNS